MSFTSFGDAAREKERRDLERRRTAALERIAILLDRIAIALERRR